jgi:hypothetical protein
MFSSSARLVNAPHAIFTSVFALGFGYATSGMRSLARFRLSGEAVAYSVIQQPSLLNPARALAALAIVTTEPRTNDNQLARFTASLRVPEPHLRRAHSSPPAPASPIRATAQTVSPPIIIFESRCNRRPLPSARARRLGGTNSRIVADTESLKSEPLARGPNLSADCAAKHDHWQLNRFCPESACISPAKSRLQRWLCSERVGSACDVLIFCVGRVIYFDAIP